MNARRLSLRVILPFVVGGLAVVLAVPTMLHAAEAGLAAVVATIPDRDGGGKHTGPSPEVAAKAVEDVLKGGMDNILALIGMFKEPDKNEDYKAYYLLHAVATHVKRPGAEEERRVVCEALAAALAGPRPVIVKARLLEELKWIGGEESVAAISKFLLDKELSDFAVQALVAVKAAEPMRAAVAKARGRARLDLIQALGALRAAKALPAATRALSDPSRDLRLAAAHALANSGDPAATEPLLNALKTDSVYEKSQVTDALLLLARRLGEAGDKDRAGRICRHILKTQKDVVHVQCAALLALAEALGDAAMDDVLAAMGSENPALRATAIEAAIAMPGEKATEHWVLRLQRAEAASKVGLLNLLARRGDPAALPAVLEATKDKDPKVRVAAIKTIGSIGNESAVAPLAALLAAQDSAERAAARHALLQLRGTQATAAVAQAVAKAAPEGRATLLGVLAGREGKEHIAVAIGYTRDGNRNVAAAAIAAVGQLADYKELAVLAKLVVEGNKGFIRAAAQQALGQACGRLPDKNKCVGAIAPALEGAKGQARASLLRVLGAIGGRTALLVVRGGLKDADADVQDAALRALSEWQTDEPAKELLEMARSTEKLTHNVLALRGYVRMIGLRENRPAAERLQMCRDALAACRRPDEKRRVLGALANIPSPEALGLAEAQYKDPALKVEAAIAAIRIAQAISGTHRTEAKAAVKRAMEVTKNREVRKQAERVLYDIERSEDFITAWMVAGPYRGGIGNKKHFPPEKPDAKDVKWKLVLATSGGRPGVLDLRKEVSGGGNICAYLRCQIESPKEQDARLEIGTDDGVTVWLNGKLIHVKEVPRSLKVNEDKVAVKFKAGWNTLLVRVSQGGGGWDACVRVRTTDGKKLRGLRFKAE